MTNEQANDIIENCLKAHWPAWEFRGQELVVWIQELRKFDVKVAEQAIDELYKSWDSIRYPKLPQIMAGIRRQAKKNRACGEHVALYAIHRADGRYRWTPFWGLSTIPRELIEQDAATKLERANMIEPGHYIQYLHSQEDAPF